MHQQFHFSVYDAAGSPTLLPLIETLWLQTGPYLNLVVSDPSFRPSNAEHVDLVNALRDHDAARARSAVEAGIIDALETISRTLEEPRAEPKQRPRRARR